MGNLHLIESEVLGVKNEVYRLKVSVLDLGLYIFGFRASRSDKNQNGWWIQPPATKTPTGWKPNPEFDKKKTLWLEIEASCIEAVSSYGSDIDDVYEPTEEELNKPISIDELDFSDDEPSSEELTPENISKNLYNSLDVMEASSDDNKAIPLDGWR